MEAEGVEVKVGRLAGVDDDASFGLPRRSLLTSTIHNFFFHFVTHKLTAD